MLNLENSNEIRTRPCPNCYLCAASGEFIYQKLQDCLFGALGEWNLKKCTNPECSLVWLDPMPLEEDIGKAYQTYYTHEDKDVPKSIIWLTLRNIYRAANMIPLYVLGLKAEEIQLNTMYLANTKPGRLLDVGCGSGKLLNDMRLTGWEVEGVDFDPKTVEHVSHKYGIKVYAGSLEKVEYSDNYFDAITMNHVIEHVHDPVSLFEECYRILKPGGHLVITTPNISSWGHQKFGAYWRGLELPRHLHIFSQKTLKECAIKSKFQETDTWTTAARSMYFFSASLDICKFGYHSMTQRTSKLHFIKSLLLSYVESVLVRINHDLGEEVVLFAKKT